MLSVYTCVGTLAQEPKRFYAKNGNEISDFWLYIRRSDKSNKFDLLKFEAFKGVAKYINGYIHKGDTIQVRSRPIGVKIVDKKTGKKRQTIIFRVAFAEFVCHKERLMINNMGGSDFPEINEDDFMYWG